MCDCKPISFADLQPGVVYHFKISPDESCNAKSWYLVVATGVTWRDKDPNWDDMDGENPRPTNAVLDLPVDSFDRDLFGVAYFSSSRPLEPIFQVPPSRLQS